MRSTNSPPWWRANAHEYSAVRAVPRCRKPVGDGAMRVRTLRVIESLGSKGLQAAQQVGLDVFDVVQAHRHAHHALHDAGGLALLFAQAPVRGAGRMGDRRLGVAEVGGDRADTRVVD